MVFYVQLSRNKYRGFTTLLIRSQNLHDQNLVKIRRWEHRRIQSYGTGVTKLHDWSD